MAGDVNQQYMMYDQTPSRESRTFGNGRHSPTSPLKLFGLAKKKINSIYVDIGLYVKETHEFLSGANKETGETNCVTGEQIKRVDDYVEKVSRIREMLSRDRMKVVFFGRTSNGKSTVINSMLKNKILPTGIGHTTHCFLQVEGADSSEGFLLTDESDTPKSIQTVSQLANALSSVKLSENSLIRICWPKDKCSLLKDDVVLLDSPGVDVSPDLDTWIDGHCLDADVFILVANAESTLMQTEKNFFHKVSAKISKPNVFILNNRWDASAGEPDSINEVKQQHLERNVHFLTEELKLDYSDAEDRVFFVSAREALIQRSGLGPAPTTPSGVLYDGYQSRYFEFCSFERRFEECISQSAVQTKFAQHTENGKHITSQVKSVLDEVAENAHKLISDSSQIQQETRDKRDYTDQQLSLITSEIKDKIRTMSDEVEKKVCGALHDEIRKLAAVVDEFDRPFHPDYNLLSVYKKELNSYVSARLDQRLVSCCSVAVSNLVYGAREDMTERMTALLPTESRQSAINFLPTNDFEVAYRLDCRNMCADFQEDITFKFSLGVTNLINKFIGKRGSRLIPPGGDQLYIPRPMTPQTPSNEVFRPPSQETELILNMLNNFNSLYSGTTVGTFALIGLVAKAAGWRIIAVCGAVYGIVYIYQRATWTTKAKERTFKKQYVNYAATKLKLVTDLTSSNCSHQVQQELASTLARLCRLVDCTKDELEEKLRILEDEIKHYEEIATRANFLKNKSVYLDSELNTFVHRYLSPESHL